MKICSIASGSSGNCIFAGSEKTSILIDAGLSGKRIEEGLNTIGYTTRDIDAVFVTHEHADHIKGLGVIARRYGLPIYTTKDTVAAIMNAPGIGKFPKGLFHEVRPDEKINFGDLKIEPFSISHDAADPVGYRIEKDGHSAAVATDMGTYTDYTVRHLKNLNVVYLEANHDVHMLEAGRYPYPLKQRILSNTGHLSNEVSGQLLCEILHDNMQQIVLSHLSKENNYPALAYEAVSAEVTLGDNPYKSGDFPITVAKRSSVGELIYF